ncbi:hypothetical protein [Methylobacterium sp. sgz302541]|uniref:hypothetical protein n=1 Tax=unclassified Methylobacterium TaxID=2615210 RepID=UPI003D33E593
MHRELIVIARELAARDSVGPPKKASLARAVSSAYYALFRALAWFVAHQTIGVRHWDDFRFVYRSLDHGRARVIFEELLRQRGVVNDIKIVAQAFVTLQQERHAADYDVGYSTSRPTVLDLIDRAEEAIDLLDRLDGVSRKQLTARLIGGRGRKS